MAIHFRCQKCSQRLSIASHKAGCATRCPRCGDVLAVPEADQNGAAAPGPLPASVPPKDLLTTYGVQGCLVLGTMLLAMVGFLVVGLVMWHVLSTPEPLENRAAQVHTSAAKAPHQSGAGKKEAASLQSTAKLPGQSQRKEPQPIVPAADDATGVAASHRPRREFRETPLVALDPPKAVDPPVVDEKPAPPPEKPRPPAEATFILPLDGLGPANKLDKLRVVRLKAKVSFLGSQNVNDINLTWCWQPHITMRVDEIHREQDMKLIYAYAEAAGDQRDGAVMKLVRQSKELPDPNSKVGQAFFQEVQTLLQQRNYRPLFDSCAMIDGQDVFTLFNKRLVIPLKGRSAAQLRSLCFALSLSNLLPLKDHRFTIEPAGDVKVKARDCRHFTVQDADGLKMDFYFDKQTTLLTKITHMGYKRVEGNVSSKNEVLWEHFFSNYRETDGIKQWRKLEVRTGGTLYATLDVVDVEYMEEIPPELRRPGGA